MACLGVKAKSKHGGKQKIERLYSGLNYLKEFIWIAQMIITSNKVIEGKVWEISHWINLTVQQIIHLYHSYLISDYPWLNLYKIKVFFCSDVPVATYIKTRQKQTEQKSW